MKYAILAVLIAATFSASAGNSNGCQGNCSGGDTTNNNQTYNQPISNGGTAHGGNASANGYGGDGGSVVGSGNSANHNTNVANGGAGGKGGEGGTGIGFGGSANQGQAQGQQQGQQQGQGQSQSSVNGQAQGQSSHTSTNTATSTAQSQSANNQGNSQSVGGQSVTINEAEQPDDITIRSAPAMMVAAPYATVSCYKTFGGSVSGILGAIGASGGRIDQSCEHRELVRLAAVIDPEAAKNVLCLNQMYGIANPKQCGGVRPIILLDKKAARQYRANQTAK